MNNKKYIIAGLIITVIIVFIVVFILNVGKNKVTCKISPYMDPGDPEKIEVTGVFKNNKLQFVNVVNTYKTEDDSKVYCGYYKDIKSDVKCSKKTIKVDKLKDLSMFGDTELIGKNESTFTKTFKDYGYSCK